MVGANGDTALILATERGYMAIVKLLLKGGADINAKDHAGRTALKIAREKGLTQIAKLLKAHGAKE